MLLHISGNTIIPILWGFDTVSITGKGMGMQRKEEAEKMSPKTISRIEGLADWATKGLITFIAGGVLFLINNLSGINTRLDVLERAVTVMQAQMVGWDVLTRMERTLVVLAQAGKGNEAMAAVAAVLRTERESREPKK